MSKRGAAVKLRIQQFYFQLTDGCGRSDCTNPDCASNPNFQKLTSDAAAAKAMILYRNKSILCGKPPSKVPRTDSEDDLQHGSTSVLFEKNGDELNNLATDKLFDNELHNKFMSNSKSKTSNDVNETSFSGSFNKNLDNFSVKSSAQSSKCLSPDKVETASSQSHSLLTKDGSKNFPASSREHPEKCLEINLDTKSKNVTCAHTTCDENINKKLKDIFVSKPVSDHAASEVRKQSTSFCQTIEEALNILSKLDASPQSNNLLSSVQESLWKVFSNSDYLNIFALLKEDIKYLDRVDQADSKLTKVSNHEVLTEDCNTDQVVCISTKLINEKMSMDDLDDEPQSSATSSKRPEVTSTVTVFLPTVNMDLVRLLYKQCAKYDQLVTVMLNAIAYLTNDIARQLTAKKENFKNDPNYLNMFVIIMENPAIHSPEALEKIFPSFCQVLSRLPVPAQAALAKYWSKFGETQLRNIMENVQQLITFKVISEIDPDDSLRSDVNANEGIVSGAKCLNILYCASMLGGKVDKEVDASGVEASVKLREKLRKENDLLGFAGFGGENGHFAWVDPLSKLLDINKLDCIVPLIPFAEFINEPLNDVIKIDKDYTNYKITQNGGTKFSFLHFPFLLNTVNKTMHLFYDNRITMYSERRRTFVSSLMQGELIHPYLKINVRRSHIIEDALIQLEYASENDFKKQLFVEFDKEEGVDEGGVSKEFFQLIIDQIFNPENGVFVYDDVTRLFWFNAQSFEALTQYKLIGIVFGLAIYNNCILDVNFPSFVYKKLLGRKARFVDLEHFQPVLYQSLKHLLEYEGNVEDDLMLTFRVGYRDVFGTDLHHDLVEGGEAISVTAENRQEYVDLYVDWLLNTSISEQFNAFLSGFDLVVSDSPVKYLFNYKELELLIRGSEDYDFEELQRTTEYDGGFTKSSQTIIDFWEVVHGLSDDEKRSLLQFSTGSDRAPVGGLAKLKMVIARNGPDSYRLPTAHTCFNVILLPDYKNKEKLKERLLKAIKYSKGFGML